MPKKTKKDSVMEDIAPNEKFSESYLSMGLGLLVVLVVGVLLYNFFATNKNKESNNNGEEGNQKQEATKSAQPGGTHTVSEGETLWDIAENYYGDGFAWEKIANTNDIADPNSIEANQKLEIPKDTETNETDVAEILPETGISGDVYIVESGDTLWAVACKELDDCYNWDKIAQLNNINDPEIIYEGNELLLP